MHILVLSWGYPEVGKKGNPFIKELAEALFRNGAKVTAMQFVFTSPFALIKKIYSFQKIINWQKSKLVKIINSYYINIIPDLKFLLTLQKKLILISAGIRLRIYILFNGKPDIIQQHYIVNAQPWITEYLYRKFKIPYVLFEHSPITDIANVEHKLDFFSKEKLFVFVKNASQRISRSWKFKEVYQNVFNCEFTVVPNLVAQHFAELPLPDFSNKKKSPFVFLSIGTLIPKKFHDRIIKAFAKKFKGVNDVFLQIAGDGPLKNELNQLIIQNNMQNQIKLLGLLSREEVFKTIDQSHVIVVASDLETFGNTIVEGMFRGLPAVSTKCGGPEEIINETNGLLSEKNEKDLAEKMRQIYNNYHNYNPEKIIEGARKKYSEDVITNKLLSLYSTIIKQS